MSVHLNTLFGGLHMEYAPLFAPRIQSAIVDVINIVNGATVRDRRRFRPVPPWWAFWVGARAALWDTC